MSRYLHTLLKAIDLQVRSGLANPEIKNLSTDSREIEKGDLFLGLDGEKVVPGGLGENSDFTIECTGMSMSMFCIYLKIYFLENLL